MPYLKGMALSFEDLILQLCAWATDATIHGVDAWELVRNDPWPRGTLLKAHGWQPGEHFYIGFMPAKLVKGSTYAEWFLNEKILTTEFVWNNEGLKLKPGDLFSYTNNSIVVGTNPGVSYSFQKPEIFEKSAQALFMGVFKQYSSGLDWHEQPGGQRPKINIKPINYYSSSRPYPMKFIPPPYPGVGFPAIGMNIDGPENGYIEFWITKDRHRIILVTNNGGYWDAAYIGFLEPYHAHTEYAFPAVVVGGTSGVSPVGNTISYGSNISPETGFLFDYSPTNWSLSHGLPTNAATPWDGSASWFDTVALSQVQLMLPDGTWQSFANWAIRKQIMSIGYGSSISYYFANQEPEQPAALKHYIRPTFSNVGKTSNIYQATVDNAITYQLEPLELVQAKPLSTNIFGSLWRMTWPSTPIYRFGEQTINGKLHLVVPNGWEGRKWHIPHGLTYTVDADSLLSQDQRIDLLSKTMNCVIRLED